jgi:insertion element IS1 protein InsB
MVVRDECPGDEATQVKNNGHIHSGQQHHRGKACVRQFEASAEERIIADEQRTHSEPLLNKRICLRGMWRAVGVSRAWRLHCMVERLAACPEHLHVQLSVRPTAGVIRQLEAEADEMWSCVQQKAPQQWIWIAMDAKTRLIMALHVGNRRRDRAQEW